MEIPFKPTIINGPINTMDVSDLGITAITIDVKSRAITLIVEDVQTACPNKDIYSLEDIDELSWQRLKSMLAYFGEPYANKQAAIEFLIGKEKIAENEV